MTSCNFVGCQQSEGCRVANVEFEYSVTLIFQPGGFTQHGAANVITYVAKLVGFIHFLHGHNHSIGRQRMLIEPAHMCCQRSVKDGSFLLSIIRPSILDYRLTSVLVTG